MTDVPNLLGFVFVLKSSSNKPDHKLTILSQINTSAEFATIQGTWQGDGGPKDITGDITSRLYSYPAPFQVARQENRHIVFPSFLWITCHWPNGMSGTNILSGTLVPNGTNIWHLNGTVVVTDSAGNVIPNKGPGDVSGDGQHLITWVPDVFGENARLATGEIVAADLTPAFPPNQTFANNSWIASQNPQANTMVAVGSTVELTVSNLNPQ
jgi:hypothetical protein